MDKLKPLPDPKIWGKPRKCEIFLLPTYKPNKPAKPI